MAKETLYLCDKKKDCNKSLSCINGLCIYTTDPSHRADKGIKEKIANAELYEWLGSFNTDSAPQCFNAVKELKKRLEDTKMTESRYRDLQMKASQTVLNAYSFMDEAGMNEEESNFFISLIMQKLSNDLVHNLFKKEDTK